MYNYITHFCTWARCPICHPELYEPDELKKLLDAYDKD